MWRSASTVRWAVASFSTGIALLAVVAVLLTAALGEGEALRRTVLGAAIVVGLAVLVVVASLDVLGERVRRPLPPGVRQPRRRSARSARP